MAENVSKEEVLKILCEKCPVYNCVSGCNSYRSIEKMSSVQSQRPQDEWKVNKYGEHFCPKCGHYALYDEEQDNDYYEVQSNFCPECGADMRKPNCVTCNHFGKCEGCEKGERQ